jgi:nascent polypeptide-associated complex subunit alpha
MIPGMNPRKMQQMAKKLGIAQQEIDANEVIIKLDKSELVFSNPQVSKVNMMGQVTYQIVGNPSERQISQTPEIEDDDLKMVIDQTGVDEEAAKRALEKNNGDIAKTILELKS